MYKRQGLSLVGRFLYLYGVIEKQENVTMANIKEYIAEHEGRFHEDLYGLVLSLIHIYSKSGSTGVGLDNLMEQYRLLFGKDIDIVSKDGHFTVCLLYTSRCV